MRSDEHHAGAGEAEGSSAQAPPPLSIWTKSLYGIGLIPNSIKAIIFGIFSLYFYTTVMGLPGTLVGIAMAVGLVWDAVIDPVIGTASDRSRGRLGKRHGLMLFGAAGMGVSFWAYFSPPEDLSVPLLFTWLLITNLLIRTLTSIYSIPYYALGAELSDDYHERTSITAFRGGLTLLGTMATAVLCFALFFPDAAPGEDPKLNANAYWAMGLFSGLAMSLVALVSTLGTLSHRQHSASNQRGHPGASTRGFLADLLLALKNRGFRAVFLSYSVFFLGTVLNATLAIHFLTYYVKITSSKAFSFFHLSFYVGALTGVVFWMRASRSVEKRRLYFIGTLTTALVMASAFLFLGEGRLFGTANLPPLLVGHGLAGFFASVLWIIPASMIADIADEDELANGERREGVFFGLFNFGEQMAAAGSLLLAGVLIDRFAGLVPGRTEQSAETIVRIGMLYGLLPCVLLALAALIVLGYSLDQHEVRNIQSRLTRNRQIGNDLCDGSSDG